MCITPQYLSLHSCPFPHFYISAGYGQVRVSLELPVQSVLDPESSKVENIACKSLNDDVIDGPTGCPQGPC